MNCRTIFNSRTVNIFTDGSVYHTKGNPSVEGNETIGCPGAIIVLTDDKCNVTQQFYSDFIIRDATNNTAELCAIELGLCMLTEYVNYHDYTINLFSDSQLCINSLRQWIYSWTNCMHNNIMYNSSGEPVKNQQIILSIINLILVKGIKVNLFHQKGHVNMNPKVLQKAQRVFKVSNNIPDVDMELIKAIAVFNDYVDIHTKTSLEQFKQVEMPVMVLEDPVYFNPNNFNYARYKNLTTNKFMRRN